MNELNRRLYDNYMDEVKEYLEFLKSKGYVLLNDFGTTNIRVNQYNAKTGNFTAKYEMFELPALILENVPNYYEFDVNTKIVNMAREILPEVSHEDLRDYSSYLNWAEKLYDGKQLKKEFNELKKINKSLEVNSIDKSLYKMPQIQAEVLVKEFVIYVDSKTMAKGYYKYDKSSNEFKKLNEKNIIELLENYFDVKDFQSFKTLAHMKSTYFNSLVKSDLPIRWNEHVKAENLMKAHQDSYKRVKKVTDNFI